MPFLGLSLPFVKPTENDRNFTETINLAGTVVVGGFGGLCLAGISSLALKALGFHDPISTVLGAIPIVAKSCFACVIVGGSFYLMGNILWLAIQKDFRNVINENR